MPDGLGIEVYADHRRFVVALGFCLWDIVDAMRNEPEVADSMEAERGMGGGA